MAYHGENEPDNPFNATARNNRNTESRWQVLEFDDEPTREPRDWSPKPPKSNYCRGLSELATESATYYDVRVRNEIREHLAAAGLADSRLGISDWERSLLVKQNAEAKTERLEFNRARKYGERDERN